MYRRFKSSPNRRPLVATLVAVILVVVGGLALWNNVLRDRFLPKNFGIVEAGQVYRSGYLTPTMLRKVIREQHIRTIVDLGGSEPGSGEQQAEVAVAAELGVRRHEFRLSGDGTGDPAQYVAALRLMADEANQPLLVHCAAGSQRTTVAVILYEHLVKGRKVEEPLRDSMRRHGHDPSDNPALLAYLVEHIEEIRRLYEAPVETIEPGAEQGG